MFGRSPTVSDLFRRPEREKRSPYTTTSVAEVKDGTFVVPGPDGDGIPPGKYRISIFRGLTREGESQALKEHKGSSRKAPGIDRETDLFEDLFGPTTSPIVREVTPGAELIVDLDKETPAVKQAQTEQIKKRQLQSGD
jgi:hypothetical protein